MRKIIAIGLLLFLALFTNPIKKKYHQNRQTNFFKAHVKVDTPEDPKNINKKTVLNNSKASVNSNVSNFYEKPKIDFIQNLGLANKRYLAPRHQKGKIAYIKKTTTP